MEEEGIDKINGCMLPLIYPLLKGLDPHLITGYSILLYFVEQVIHTGKTIMGAIMVLPVAINFSSVVVR